MAANNVRITTQIVNFGIESAGGGTANLHLSAEIDDRDNGFNKGVTSFVPGQKAYFLVFKSAGINLSPPVASAGTASYGNPETNGTTAVVGKTDFITFANEPEGTLDVPAKSIATKEWIGANLGDIELVNDTTLRLINPPAGIYAGVLKVTYNAEATVGVLDSEPFSKANPTLTEFEIVVVVVGTVGTA